jgi:hypothetical protein
MQHVYQKRKSRCHIVHHLYFWSSYRQVKAFSTAGTAQETGIQLMIKVGAALAVVVHAMADGKDIRLS